MRYVALLAGSVAMMLAQVPRVLAAQETGAQKYRVYVGTYTSGGGGSTSRGIYLLELDMATGALTSRGVAGEAVNPSFLAVHPGRRFLYAVGETAEFNGQKTGAVSAFTIDQAGGSLSLLNQQSSQGQGPCYVVVDRAGKNALVANYNSGSVACLPIGADGRLAPASSTIQHQGSSVNPQRQKEPHAHSINLDAANKFAVAADLGLDQLLVYRFDTARGTLTPNDPPFARVAPGSGPRHFAFHPDGKHAYVINEMACTVTAFDYDPDRGTLSENATASTLPEGPKAKNYSTAEVQVHPSGRFLYGSNRGHNTIAIFAIDPAGGRIRPLGHQDTGGRTPRNFGIDPTGRYLLAANQDSGTVVVFRIDPQSGLLQPTGQTAEVPRPVCIKFVPLSD
jgi:6-phosphogluconolactonase